MSESMSSVVVNNDCVKRLAIEFPKDINTLLQSLAKSNVLLKVLDKRDDKCCYCLCESDVKHFHWILSEEKVIKPLNENKTEMTSLSTLYSKDSFDRFGDDLNELVLSYLTFEEKIRFECVSKQWKRSVYQKQYNLNINHNSMKLFRIYSKREVKEMTGIESILIKCPNITSIYVSTSMYAKNREEVFELIVKYCRYLTQITAQFRGLSSKTSKIFFEKFGTKLKKITFISYNTSTKECLKLCLNLKSLVIKSFFSNEFFNDIHKYLPKLQHIHCSNTELSYKVLKSLSKLSDLRTIYFISITFTQIDESVVLKFLKRCHKIKSIYVKNYDIIIDLNERQILELRRNDWRNLEIIRQNSHN